MCAKPGRHVKCRKKKGHMGMLTLFSSCITGCSVRNVSSTSIDWGRSSCDAATDWLFSSLFIRKTYILLYCALLCFFMLFHAFSCFSVKAREKYNKSNPPYFSECLGIWLKK